ncbi:hypothetical protein R3P38DRAFT_3186190 [Favolaschia claudopus]|uniref:Uncharacterized protein n=1 Tax=Favolaschia claudopus TaxID=2862362 RepID=A0AAW0C527_9AGAR
MSVENFWRNLKHGTLHHLLHPQLDQLAYLIATEIVPAFEAKMQIFDPNYRSGGRAKALTPFQRQFKKGWKTLESRALGIANIKQMFRAGHAVNSPDPAFFCEVVRRRTIPFYHHPLLKAKDGSVIASIEGSGSLAPPRGVKRKRAATPGVEASSSRGTGRMDDPFQLSSSPIRQDEYLDEEDENV